MYEKPSLSELISATNKPDFLEHYGILGMKWGVRRTPEQLGRKTAKLRNKNTKLEKKAVKYDTKAAKTSMKVVKRIKKNQVNKKTLKLSVKSAKFQKKAAKYRIKILKNDKISRKFETQLNQMSKADIELGREAYYKALKH